MVTCKLIGRTGNQCFIAAACIGYAKQYGLEYHIPAHTQDDEQWKPMFTHLENPNYNPDLPIMPINEKGFIYNTLPEPSKKDCNIELSGYFQSYKYFSHCINNVREAFGIPYNRMEGWTAIHLRLGDYKTKPDHHPLITSDYLLRAANILVAKGFKKFIIFSDDMKEAFDILNFQNLIPARTCFEFAGSDNEINDLMFGSCCDNIIGSNSSFSLWMYYLNQYEEKIGVFPKRWFGPKLNHDTKDLYPENCIIL